jgi:hypothetical protein
MKVLFTSALIPYRYEERKEEYIDSFNSLCPMIGKDNIIIGEFYLDTHQQQTLFLAGLTEKFHLTKTHQQGIRNKGVLWIKGMLKMIEESGVEDEDYLIHLTGRYKFDDDILFRAIKENPDYDIYYKKTDGGTQGFTGGFGCKGSVMVEFLKSVDLNRMEMSMINIERIFKEFADTKSCFYLDEMGISARIFGNGSGQLITHKI